MYIYVYIYVYVYVYVYIYMYTYVCTRTHTHDVCARSKVCVPYVRLPRRDYEGIVKCTKDESCTRAHTMRDCEGIVKCTNIYVHTLDSHALVLILCETVKVL